MRAVLVVLLIALMPACDSGETRPTPKAQAQRWRFVGGKVPVEVATEPECKELLLEEENRAKEVEETALAAREKTAAVALAMENDACLAAMILCDIRTPAKKKQCDETRARLATKCQTAKAERIAVEKQLAESLPARTTLRCEPITTQP